MEITLRDIIRDFLYVAMPCNSANDWDENPCTPGSKWECARCYAVRRAHEAGIFLEDE